MIDKQKIKEKWSSVIEGLNNENNTDCLSGYNYNNTIQDELGEPSESIKSDFSGIMFPMVRRVFSSTLGGGGMRKSKTQQLKENRINKLRELQGETPNVVLPDDEHYDGLVSVAPMSMPNGQLFYIDFMYHDDPKEILRDERKSKLDKINISFRKDKLEYIEKIIKQNG